MLKVLTWLTAVIVYIRNWASRMNVWVRYQYIRQFKLIANPAAATEASLTDLRDEDILYHSEHFIVVNKRSDIVINSDDPKHPVSVAKQLAHKFPHTVDPKMKFQFRFLHRLDYATSGAMCVALTKKGAQQGSKAFSKRYVSKHYLALARGHMNPTKNHSFDIELPIGQDSSIEDRCVMCTPNNPHCTAPRHASTRVILLEHGTYDRGPASKVLLIPNTGRTHQLRVHLCAIQHPIVGDYTYSFRQDIKPHRMMLHAYRLVVPMKHESIDVTAPDTFTPQHDKLWKPAKVFQMYENYIEESGLRTEK